MNNRVCECYLTEGLPSYNGIIGYDLANGALDSFLGIPFATCTPEIVYGPENLLTHKPSRNGQACPGVHGFGYRYLSIGKGFYLLL